VTAAQNYWKNKRSAVIYFQEGERMVSKEQGQKCARKYQMMFIESSAKTKEGVQTAFEELGMANRPTFSHKPRCHLILS
jgi:hypothetical protein